MGGEVGMGTLVSGRGKIEGKSTGRDNMNQDG